MDNCCRLSDYEKYKLEQEKRWEERIAAQRNKIIERKRRQASANENMAMLWETYKVGDVISTNAGIFKIAKIDKTSITTWYGKNYTTTQLFGGDVAKLIKERMKSNGCKW